MNELTVNFGLFELNLWEGLALLVALFLCLSFILEKGTAKIEEELGKAGIPERNLEHKAFAFQVHLLPGAGGCLFGGIDLFLHLTSGTLTTETVHGLLASSILGANLFGVLAILFALLRFWEVKNLPLHFLVKQDILMVIIGSVGEKFSHDMYLMGIKDTEQARLLVEGIPLVTKYQELLAKQQRLSKKAKTEQQHQLLVELESIIQEKKVEVQALFPIIYGAVGMGNPYLEDEREWEEMERILEESNINRSDDSI